MRLSLRECAFSRTRNRNPEAERRTFAKFASRSSLARTSVAAACAAARGARHSLTLSPSVARPPYISTLSIPRSHRHRRSAQPASAARTTHYAQASLHTPGALSRCTLRRLTQSTAVHLVLQTSSTTTPDEVREVRGLVPVAWGSRRRRRRSGRRRPTCARRRSRRRCTCCCRRTRQLLPSPTLLLVLLAHEVRRQPMRQPGHVDVELRRCHDAMMP